MKKILYITGAISLFLIIFFMVGIVKRTVKFEQELSFDKPPKMVYYAMMNPMRMDEWIQGFQKAEALDGFLNGPGSRYLMTIKLGGKEFQVLEEITTFKWKEELGVHLNFKHMTVLMDIHFNKIDGGTQVHIKSTITGNSLFWKAVVPYLKPGLKRHMDTNFENLRMMLDQD
jgi:hypothetical protein